MSNIIEKHPSYTLLVVALSVMTATWAILTFVLEDNKINFYKAQVESVNAENSSYKARIDFLQKENDKINETNKIYFEQISKDPNSIIFLQKKLGDLAKDNISLKSKNSATSNIDSIRSKQHDKFDEIVNIERGEAYYSKETEAIIGLNEIDVDRNASINLKLPNEAEETLKVKAGKSFNYTLGKNKYKLIITNLNYYSNTLTVQFKEE